MSKKVFSSDHNRKFETEHSVAEIKNHPTEKDKLEFTIDGISEVSWFRQKQREFLEGVRINARIKGRGLRN